MINVSWAQLKQILAANGLTLQWFQDDNSYTVFDQTLTFTVVIPITTPAGITQQDFEANYKTNSGYSGVSAYSSSAVVQPGTTPTDIITLTGSSTKIVRLSKIVISGKNALPTNATISLVYRNTLDSGGTSTNPIIVPHDPNNTSATAIVTVYTANPTPGVSAGVLRVANLEFSNTGGNPVPLLVWDFDSNSLHRPALRNNTQQLCVSLNGTQVSAVHIAIEWTEQ